MATAKNIQRADVPSARELTREDLLKIIGDAGFQVDLSAAHPFLGETPVDEWCLWCKECGRDSGFHYEKCSKARQLVEDLQGILRLIARDAIGVEGTFAERVRMRVISALGEKE